MFVWPELLCFTLCEPDVPFVVSLSNVSFLSVIFLHFLPVCVFTNMVRAYSQSFVTF